MAETAGTSGESAVQRLAARYGVATEYEGFDGTTVTVPQDTLRSVLTALGADVTDDDAVARSLREREAAPWLRLLPPVVVAEAGRGDTVAVTLAEGDSVRIRLWPEDEPDEARVLEPEQGGTPESAEVDGRTRRRVQYALPQDLPLGWYRLEAVTDSGERAEVDVAVTPVRLSTTDRLRGRRRWGYMAQLYSVMSSRSWGVGDLSDLASLAAISGVQGADYVLINPLHAAEPAPPVEPSPYLPSSRRFFNPLYLRIGDVAEFPYLRPADREVVARLAAIQRKAVLDPGSIDRDSAYAAKLKSLELLYTVRRSPYRQQQLEAFVAHAGQPLQDFALWCALREELGEDSPLWQDGARSPEAPYAREARSRLSHRINFHVWLQWLLDEQLEAAQRAAHRAGMDIGVMHDLAVGVHKHGADAWALQDVMASGVSVGAPADMYNQLGQDWSQPPWHPEKLAAAGYRPWREMMGTIFRHSGGVRIDHVAGLFRLWWIPEGNDASDGTYVYYDHEAMVGVLALEAELAGVVVVGEDLGTVEDSVREHLERKGVLGTSILWFEMDGEVPLDPSRYRELCMASVNTHDLPPTPGYLDGVQLQLREDLGLLARSPEEERADARRQLETFFTAVQDAGYLPEGLDAPQERKIEALYRYLCDAPSLLLNVALVDAVGEKRIQNQPGTSDEYPNWRVPLADSDGRPVMLESLPRTDRVNALVDVLNEALGTHRRTPTGRAPRQPERRDPTDPLGQDS
ncbi:4-alpha-glucanotransferase [Kocuria tytonicola]|uniref:4-alpha-glucanotransferase n=1 Tax=Kocuria tytonicola TaxID=2055946 RepID=A0A3L9L5E0_9MICC|nr:4-alpha-glucanotransferase [Kocuria tytonicola]RLY94206.1 4-alpha-glucanotransferase [Kocuria tytonicola]